MIKDYIINSCVSLKNNNMRYLVTILTICVITSCHHTLDVNMVQIMSIKNFTDEAIYVQYSYKDNLQATPKLELFLYLPDRAPNEEDLDPYCSPKYRINPHTYSNLAEQSADIKKWIPFPNNPEIDYVNFFFIKESTMKNYTWEEIVQKQLYERKVKYTYDELEELNYEIIYKL